MPRRAPVAALAAVALLVGAAEPLSAQASAADPPALAVDERGYLVLARLPPILADQAVARQLESGLTTSFVVTVELGRPRGDAGRGGARVDVRYELWDEVFEATAIDLAGGVERCAPTSAAELAAWWAGLELPIFDLGGAGAAAGPVTVTLEVVPFSYSEAADTQRWVADSVSRAQAGGGEGASTSPNDAEDSLTRVLGVLMATSIRRRAVTTRRWELPLPEAPR